MNKIIEAAQVAKTAHQGQRRKDKITPYILHPARVAARVTLHLNTTEEMIIAAWLHDTREDTSLSQDEIVSRFGLVVYKLIEDLTNPSKSSKEDRATRKKMDLLHLRHSSDQAKIIKLYDRLDNLQEMTTNDFSGNFIRMYAMESLDLAGTIGDACPTLAMELEKVARVLHERF